jgi:hypothetical protein
MARSGAGVPGRISLGLGTERFPARYVRDDLVRRNGFHKTPNVRLQPRRLTARKAAVGYKPC